MEGKIKTSYPGSEYMIQDVNGDASHVVISVVAPQFAGMMTLARHRAINSLLKQEIGQIHAVTIKTKTPD
jgi:stress-induced morphogen